MSGEVPEAGHGTKRAFLVLAPEGHGGHFVTDLLVHAGCHGHAGDHVPWRPDARALGLEDDKPWDHPLPTDVQPWDRVLPTNEDPVVWRRSMPHDGKWVDIEEMVRVLRARGYAVTCLVVARDRYCALRSQLKWRHVNDLETGEARIDQAHRHIAAALDRAEAPCVAVNYDALVKHPETQDILLERLGLELPVDRLEVWDGNRKWLADRPADARVTTTPPGEPVDVGFPEAWFPCLPYLRPEYDKRVRLGEARMGVSRAVFCGLARDVQKSLPSVAGRIERAGAMFGDYRVVIYENDSTDGTRDFLQAWARLNPRVEILSETLHTPRWGRERDTRRTRQLAACRNRYLAHAVEHHAGFDHLIVLDTDLPRGFSPIGLATSFGYRGWHVMGSNGIAAPLVPQPPDLPMFFDAWAFRAEGRAEPLPFAEINRLHFLRGQPPFPVWSCFGGLAVYDMAALRSGARYGGDDCEHVVLHRRLRRLGFGEQYLNPSQIVLYSGDE